MRVLFLESHPMWIHGLPNGFRDAGHQVKISGPLTPRSLQTQIARFRPHLIVSLGWTPEHRQHNRKWIRKYVGRSGIPHVYWATEDPTHTEYFTLPYIRAVKPDFVFTICRSRVKDYRRMGIRSAHLDFGYHPKVHRPVKARSEYRCSIAVVANAYPRNLVKYPKHYRKQSLRKLISPLVRQKIRIDFWGRKWGEMKRFLGADIPKSWIHGYLPYPKANQVYSSAKINIGLQNKLTQVTQRTYEILGSGGFLLTSDTPEIRRLFKPGEHLAVSSSPQQTMRLVRYYLNHPEQRERIRKAGLQAVKKHSYKQRALQMIRELRRQGILKRA
ncbi:CgeB family protein [Paenibacillus tyrfis]|uniref:CgeB family protein n=1 Tax=Paenibacillus tyrfis TaxID=1501230 RepID=UPI00209DDAAD|nr:glycosyltransferase [Paenibacillus tyrfis]MCP1310961.1 glycosyltransferase [Paenibacillus tyrfis]